MKKIGESSFASEVIEVTTITTTSYRDDGRSLCYRTENGVVAKSIVKSLIGIMEKQQVISLPGWNPTRVLPCRIYSKNSHETPTNILASPPIPITPTIPVTVGTRKQARRFSSRKLRTIQFQFSVFLFLISLGF
jgi:hypothetical protein